MNTPWGASQHVHTIAEGVFEVDTAGHGGILVCEEVAPQFLSSAAIAKGWRWGGYLAYEEDCDWALFAYEQPELYVANRDNPGLNYVYRTTAAELKQIAHTDLLLFHPDYLAQVEKGVAQRV